MLRRLRRWLFGQSDNAESPDTDASEESRYSLSSLSESFQYAYGTGDYELDRTIADINEQAEEIEEKRRNE